MQKQFNQLDNKLSSWLVQQYAKKLHKSESVVQLIFELANPMFEDGPKKGQIKMASDSAAVVAVISCSMKTKAS